MQKPPIPANESARIAALHQCGLLDTPADARLEQVVGLAAALANTPMAALTLIDTDRAVIGTAVGLRDRDDQPRDISFCGHVVGHGCAVVVPDTLLDVRFHDNPLVQGDPHLRFYAGYPLRDTAGHAYGALCVLDTIVRELSGEQTSALQRLAEMTSHWLESEART